MKFIIFLLFQKYVRRGPVDNNPVLVPTMAWHQTGDKPPSEPMMVWLCISRPQWVNDPERKTSRQACHVNTFWESAVIRHQTDCSALCWFGKRPITCQMKGHHPYRCWLSGNVTQIIIFQSGLRFGNSQYPLCTCHGHNLTNSSVLKLISNCGCRFQRGSCSSATLLIF